MPRLARVSSLCSCLVLLVAGACGDDGGGAESGSTGVATGSSTGAPSGSTGPVAPASSSTTAVTTVADSSTTDDSNGTSPQGECVLWEADECGAGRKCMPYSLEADSVPDEIRCCDAVENPALDGEPCEGIDYNGSCLDNCEPGTMCVLDDEDSLTGLCRSFCDPAGNDCDPDQTCKAFFELLLAVPNIPTCMQQCDPLVQNCSPPGWHCIPDTPTESGQSGFLCTPPPPSPPRGMFEPCALANQCEPGLVCVTDDRVPGCTFASCCTAFCDLGEGDSVCQALDPNLECTDWMSPDPAWQDVGACTLPQ